jgi:hypothetical protein
MKRFVLALFACWYLVATSVSARPLDVQVKNVRTPSAAVTATVELRDVLPDRFRKLVDDGGVLHLRVQTELWESRPVWDRLVYPAIVRVFRFKRAAGSALSITDPDGTATTYPSAPQTLPVVLQLGAASRITPVQRYYVHVIATLGTLAEREADEVGDAVFGRDSETNGSARSARLVFRTVLQVSDYLQSVTAETKSRRLSGWTCWRSNRRGRRATYPEKASASFASFGEKNSPYLPVTFSVSRRVDASARLAGAAPGGRSAASNVAIASIREPRGRAMERSNQ